MEEWSLLDIMNEDFDLDAEQMSKMKKLPRQWLEKLKKANGRARVRKISEEQCFYALRCFGKILCEFERLFPDAEIRRAYADIGDGGCREKEQITMMTIREKDGERYKPIFQRKERGWNDYNDIEISFVDSENAKKVKKLLCFHGYGHRLNIDIADYIEQGKDWNGKIASCAACGSDNTLAECETCNKKVCSKHYFKDDRDAIICWECSKDYQWEKCTIYIGTLVDDVKKIYVRPRKLPRWAKPKKESE